MSDHYCCKACGLHYDDCRCPPLKTRTPKRTLVEMMRDIARIKK